MKLKPIKRTDLPLTSCPYFYCLKRRYPKCGIIVQYNSDSPSLEEIIIASWIKRDTLTDIRETGKFVVNIPPVGVEES